MVVLRHRLAIAGVNSGVRQRLACVEVVLAFAAFAAPCAVVLSFAPQLDVEPDGVVPAGVVQVPSQWVELSGGRYISEKAPGYPFLAVPFQALGVIRWAPLFYGALACLGLFVGARAGSGASAA
jgi:hypothetical protein